MDNFVIGTTKLDGKFAKKNRFKLQPGNNFYRILPPMFSLAAAGKIAEYHAIHWAFTDTKGNKIPIACIQEKDSKTKMITRHCPLCNKYEQLLAQHEAGKIQGAPKEQLEAFLKNVVDQVKANKNFYLNAVNQNNEIGVLAIPYKSFNALKALLLEQNNNRFDPTAKVGCFLNFKKTQAFKGDRDTAYSVELGTETFTDQTGQMLQRVKMHELTVEIINRLPTEATDLSLLFKVLTSEQLEILIQLSPEERSKNFEKFMGFSERPVENQSLGTSIPGTNASALATPVFTGEQIQFAQFGAPQQGQPVVKTEDKPPFNPPFLKQPVPQVQLSDLNAAFAPSIPSVPSVPMGTSQVSKTGTLDASTWSDADFAKAFGPTK